MRPQPKIQDYAVIGDGRSAALISNDGSVDWMCWPRFDGPSVFGGLLDQERGGYWRIQPTAPAQSVRRYVADTNVLQTRFDTSGGSVELTDFLPAASEEQKRQMLWPEQELVRHVACEAGELELAIDFQPRPDFGRAKFRLYDGGRLGLRINMGSWLLALRGEAEFQCTEHGASARLRLRAGESASFSLIFSNEGPAVLPPLGDEVLARRDLTIAWWQQWARRAKYEGPYRDEVIRGALVLKLMSFAPSGAIVAAPTTSLPERLGGDRNWDYRYCWLRDSAFTARALFGLGYREEAEAFVSWALHATRLTRPELRIIYDIYGEACPNETELTGFSGYGGSRPVRIGNAARNQLQLDVYGEVIEAVTHFVNSGGELDGETRQMLRHFGSFVCRHWQEPDNGIWEPRGRREHFTHSRLLCWVALDRLLKLHERGKLPDLRAKKCHQHRQHIRRDIEDLGWNEKLESYTQALGGNTLDATALLLSLHEFNDPAGWRMQRTNQRLVDVLGAGPGLMYRYEQSFEGREGTFAMCGFWLAGFLARGGGTLEAAHQSMAATLGYANDVGLFAEEIDAHTGDALGNFPQAFTHIGLINAALSLAEREQRDRNDQDRKVAHLNPEPRKNPHDCVAGP
jgi:GH15 family glucan-1,4-alpha-glucosidase